MKTDVYQIVTDKIIQRLEQGVLPWKHYSTLRAEECAPRNLVSQRPYHGVNFFLLSMMGYRSPNWMTFRQAQELGGHVRKGEHSMPIVHWNFVERTDKETGEVKSVPFLKYFSVFNAEQVEGINSQIPAAGTERETTANQEAELIVANMAYRPRIENGAFPIACYHPLSDTVQMTEQKLCVSDERYYEVLFHELIHSTGHKSRLNREKDMGGWQQFGSREYSKRN
jgi:antirestriction protein ArdC